MRFLVQTGGVISYIFIDVDYSFSECCMNCTWCFFMYDLWCILSYSFLTADCRRRVGLGQVIISTGWVQKFRIGWENGPTSNSAQSSWSGGFLAFPLARRARQCHPRCKAVHEPSFDSSNLLWLRHVLQPHVTWLSPDSLFLLLRRFFRKTKACYASRKAVGL